MRKATLYRLDSSDQGTFGVLVIKKSNTWFFTGELPWRGNKSNISCIPKGAYRVVWTRSPRFKRCMYLVAKVKNRLGIRVHSANFVGDRKKGFRRQLAGCITLGEKLGWLGGQKAVLISRPAVRKFEALANGEPFEIDIR